jgi:hypothetical protein
VIEAGCRPVAWLLIDHDNLIHWQLTLREVVESLAAAVVSQCPAIGSVAMRIRAYGGWFECDSVTALRYEAAEYYQRNCPSVFAHGSLICRTIFEFADYLAGYSPLESDNAVRITSTFARRASPQPALLTGGAVTCEEPNCELKKMVRWLRRRKACTKQGCPHSFSEFFERHEQKQVDVHIALDAIHYSDHLDEREFLAVASDDADLVPALAAAGVKQVERGHVLWMRSSGAPRVHDLGLLRCGVQVLTLEGQTWKGNCHGD